MAIRVSSDASVPKRTANLPSSTAMTIAGWFPIVSVPARFYGPLGVTAAVDGTNFMQISSAASGSAQQQLFWVSGALSSGTNLISIAAGGTYFFAITCSGTASGNVIGYAREYRTPTFSTASNSSTRDAMTIGAVEWGRDSFTGDFIDGAVFNAVMFDRALDANELLRLSFDLLGEKVTNKTSLNVYYRIRGGNDLWDRSGNARQMTVTAGVDRPSIRVWPRTDTNALPFSVGAAGDITGTAGLTFSQSGSLKGDGALSGTNGLTFGQSGTLGGLGALTGTNGLTFGQSGALSGVGALSATGTLTFAQTGNLAGTGALSGTATLTFSQSGTLDAPSGAMTGSGTLTFSQVGTLTGTGDLAGTVAMVFGASADADQTRNIDGTGAMVFGAFGTLDQPAGGAIGPFPGGGGGGFYEFRDEGKRRKRKSLSTLLDESLPEVYAELTRGPKSVVLEARAIVKPFESERAGIDWGRLEASAASVGRLLALVAKQRTADRERAQRQALQRSDEEWFLMD